MNHTITKNGNDFNVDYILGDFRSKTVQEIEDKDLNKVKYLKFPMLKGEDVIVGNPIK